MALDKNRDGNRDLIDIPLVHLAKPATSCIVRVGHAVDLPSVTPILTAIFGSSDYIARGGGGDFCLPGATEYQPLHSDSGTEENSMA